MDKLAQAIATLKAESKRLGQELRQIQAGITALETASNNGRGITTWLSGRTLSASTRKRIAAAQKARWAKWRAARRRNAA
jgi:hypothetical protein